MRGNSLKQAPVMRLQLDKERLYTFDFNTMAELQQLSDNPYALIAGLYTGEPKYIRQILYAGLLSGEATQDDGFETELTQSKVGNMLGTIIYGRQPEKEKVLLDNIYKSIELFFPIPDKKEDKKEKRPETKKDTPKKEPEFDLAWYLYIATVEMGIPEERFWRMTMRKFDLIWKQHLEFKYPKATANGDEKPAQEVRGTIDQIDLF